MGNRGRAVTAALSSGMRVWLVLLWLVTAGPRVAAAEPFEPAAFRVEVSGTGRPIIFIPGVACPGSVWTDAVAHFTGYQAHVITLAGFAGVPRIEEPGISAATVRDLARYIRDRKLDHPIIIGHSHGGFIAYWLAAEEPSLVGPVISVDMSPALDGGLEEATTLRDRWYRASDKQAASLLSGKFYSMTGQRKRMAKTLEAIKKTDRRALGDATYEMVMTDLRPRLPAITAPVLSIVANGGGQHRIKKRTRGIPDHRFIVVPTSAHFVWWDAPKPFFKAVDAFLAEHADK